MSKYHPETEAIMGGRPDRTPGKAVNGGIQLSSTFYVGGENNYGRYNNETWQDLESVLGKLENGQALIYASGLAAVNAVLDLIPGGGKFVIPTASYLGTGALIAELEKKGRIKPIWVDITKTDEVIAALDGAQMLYFESPTNPLLDVAEVQKFIDAAHARKILVAVDNTFATPLNQKPLDMGADVVIHSLTKALSGHSDILLGAAITKSADLYEKLLVHRKFHGSIAGPFEAWLALRGVRTFPMRMRQSSESAAILVDRLKKDPAISRVRYPGFGFMISIEFHGGAVAADKALAAAKIWSNATSLGGVESLWERRRLHPEEPDTVPESLIRMSVGCEHVEDLWSDLAQALLSSGK